MLDRLKSSYPDAKIHFFDSYAPTDLRFANVANNYVTTYVKKHVFKDRSKYFQSTHGDTTLVEFYNKFFGLPQEPDTNWNVPDSFLDKLVFGHTFFTEKSMLEILSGYKQHLGESKIYNVHARMETSQGSPWYLAMCKHALETVQGVPDSIISNHLVKTHKYLSEMRKSKIVFSPYGYGEACWRDFEAILSGALLIKQDMSEIETTPDIYADSVTYVGVKPDLSDLHDKISYYLENEAERLKIVDAAYSKLREYVVSRACVNMYKDIFK